MVFICVRTAEFFLLFSFPSYLTLFFFLYCCPDIEREKAEQKLFQGISSFDKSAMRQVSTEEKSVLPTKEGNTGPAVPDSKCRVAIVLTKGQVLKHN